MARRVGGVINYSLMVMFVEGYAILVDQGWVSHYFFFLLVFVPLCNGSFAFIPKE
jgi:hypothetical protein